MLCAPLLLLAVVASSAEVRDDARDDARDDTRDATYLAAPALGLNLGVLGSGYAQTGARFGDLHAAAAVDGLYRLGPLTAEAGLLALVPFARHTTATTGTLGLALGWTAARWRVAAGALVQWAGDARPALQWLPQARASLSFGHAGVTLALFDRLGLVPARLSLDLRLHRAELSVGWAAPLGVIASASLPLLGSWALRADGFAFKLVQSEYVMATLGLLWRGGT